MHYWEDLQLVHEIRCYGYVHAKCEMSLRTLILAVWMVLKDTKLLTLTCPLVVIIFIIYCDDLQADG